MKLRALVIVALLAGFGCSLLRPDKPRVSTTPITGAPEDYQPLIEASSATRFLLLGESTHGTREFIDERMRIVNAAGSERRVLAVVFEADAGEMDTAAMLLGDEGAPAAVRAFRNYPTWPWRSEPFRDALASIQALQEAERPDILLVGFDFHGFSGVIDRMRNVEAPADYGRLTNEARICFDRYADSYDHRASQLNPTAPCSTITAALLTAADDVRDPIRKFRLSHLARTLRAAEDYYIAIARGGDPWTLREQHMLQTLVALDELFATDEGVIVVWAHNTHVGDARVTSFRPRPTLGQLLRETRPGRAYLVGMSTGRGHLWAARSIGSPATEMRLNPPLRDSVEYALARACKGNCLVTSRRLGSDLNLERMARAIGLVYRPGDELRSHYIRSIAARQFDAIVYLDTTTAVGTIE